MRYLETPPSPKLSHVIRHFWSLEQSAEEARESKEPVLPDGCPEVVFNLADRFRRFSNKSEFELQPRTLFAGQITKRILIGPMGEVRLFGVRFQPYGAFAILRVPMSELRDQIEAFDLLAPDLERSLRDRLLETDDFSKRVGIFESALLERLLPSTVPERSFCLVAEVFANSGDQRVSQIAAKLGWTERKIERDFNKYIGISPKAFGRIMRFSSIVRALENSGPEKLLDHAHEFGYYDQSHMINEFRGFAGESPTAFYQRSHRLSELFTIGK